MSNLEQQFNDLQKLPQGMPLLNSDELASILKATAHNPAEDTQNKKRLWRVGMSIISGLSLIGIVAALWLHGSDSKQLSSTQPEPSPMAKQESIRAEQESKPVSGSNTRAESKTISQQFASENAAAKQESQQQEYRVISLDEKEFRRLHISVNGDVIDFTAAWHIDTSSSTPARMAKMGLACAYDAANPDHAVLSRHVFSSNGNIKPELKQYYNAEDYQQMRNVLPLYPAYYCTNTGNGRVTGTTYMTTVQEAMIFQKSADDFYRSISLTKGKNSEQHIRAANEFLRNSLLPKHMICTAIPWNNGNNTLFVWFVPTKEFIAALSPMNAEYVLSHYHVGNSLHFDVNSLEIAAEQQHANKKQEQESEWGSDIVAMKSLKSLSLNTEELAALGITRTKDNGKEKILIPSEEKITIREAQKPILQSMGIDVSRPRMLMKNRWIIVMEGNESSGLPTMEHDTMLYSKTCPVYIVNQMFEYDSATHSSIEAGSARFWNSNSPLFSNAQSARSDSILGLFTSGAAYKLPQATIQQLHRELDKESAMCLKNLIPLSLMIGDSSIKRDGNKFSCITVFFVPTPELVQILPERYRNDIQNELTALQNVDMGVPARTACANLRGESYFGVCKMYSQNIERMTVFPSVTSGMATCRITASKSMTVRLAAHYVNGGLARELAKSVSLNKGDNDITIDLRHLENGMYVISAESDAGDVVIQRVVRQ